ncbi:unnamed protein product [Musa hybrid cultivar]
MEQRRRVAVRRTQCEEKARCPRPRRSEFKRLFGRKSDKSTPAASREILPIGHVTVLDAPDVLDKQLIVALHFLNSLPPHSSSNFVPAIRYRDHVDSIFPPGTEPEHDNEQIPRKFDRLFGWWRSARR